MQEGHLAMTCLQPELFLLQMQATIHGVLGLRELSSIVHMMTSNCAIVTRLQWNQSTFGMRLGHRCLIMAATKARQHMKHAMSTHHG